MHLPEPSLNRMPAKPPTKAATSAQTPTMKGRRDKKRVSVTKTMNADPMLSSAAPAVMTISIAVPSQRHKATTVIVENDVSQQHEHACQDPTSDCPGEYSHRASGLEFHGRSRLECPPADYSWLFKKSVVIRAWIWRSSQCPHLSTCPDGLKRKSEARKEGGE